MRLLMDENVPDAVAESRTEAIHFCHAIVYTTYMTAHDERQPQTLTKAELRARVIGNSLEHDAEDILFWRNASDTLRGQTLYRLLARGRAMHAAVPHQIEMEEGAVRLLLTPKHARTITIPD